MTPPRRTVGSTAHGNGRRVAYIMSRFPKITETFVLYEMGALEEDGVEVEVFPLLRGPDGPRHPEAVPYEERAHFSSFLGWRVLAANARRLVRSPRAYVRTWLEAVRATWGSPRFLAGALAYFPKCVAFADHMERLGVTHIHAHFANHPALAALMVHRLTGIPYSFTAHGSDLHVDRRGLGAKVAAASFVVAVSGYNKELIEGECGESARGKVVVIHCGTDPDTFAPPPGNEQVSPGHPPRPLRMVCVASFEEVKGHRFLLEACRLLAERDVDFHLDLAGDGPVRQAVEDGVRRHGLEHRVTVHGAVPRPEVKKLLARSDVAVLASHPTASGKREGIPVALMEAMMARLPVVASGVSGIPELVDHGETGFLVPPGDPWALADSLRRLAADPELRIRFGTAGREKVGREFDLRRGASLLVEQIDRSWSSQTHCNA